MINNVTLVGRLTKDPELTYTPNGIAKATFILAVKRNFSNQQGERDSDFIRIVVWRKPAESVANHLKKGNLAGVEGRIETSNYEGADGKRVYNTDVVADRVQFLEPKREGQGNTQSQGNNYQHNQQNQNQQYQQNQSNPPYSQQQNYSNQQNNSQQYQQNQNQNPYTQNQNNQPQYTGAPGGYGGYSGPIEVSDDDLPF